MTFDNPLGEFSTDGPPATNDDGADAKGMRARIEEQAARIRELEELNDSESTEFHARSMAQGFDALGLDPEEGIGKAVAVTFDGEPEQLAEFAETEFGYTPSFEHPYARSIARGQAELDQLSNTGGSVAPLTQADELARAESRGDHDTAMAIKSDQLARMFGR